MLSGIGQVSKSLGTSFANQDAVDEASQAKDEFLQMLIAQLKNQDPTAPQDADKFADQITQFGQLEQLLNINDNIEKLNGNFAGGDKLEAVQLIGKTAVVEGNQIEVSDSTVSQFGVKLDGPASLIKVHVLNEAGAVVRSLEYQNVSAGKQFLDFDGNSQDGNPLPEGKYFFSAEAVGNEGVPTAVSTLMGGKISDVEFLTDGVLIKSGSMAFNMNDIISVRE